MHAANIHRVFGFLIYIFLFYLSILLVRRKLTAALVSYDLIKKVHQTITQNSKYEYHKFFSFYLIKKQSQKINE